MTPASDACSVPPSAGDCGGSETKWYFDYRDSTCRPFEYTGCGGNVNRCVLLVRADGTDLSIAVRPG